MDDPQTSIEAPGQPDLFGTQPPQPSNRGKIVGAAIAIVVLAIVAVVFFAKGGKTASPASQNKVQPADVYAPNLTFYQPVMSESTSFSGGKSTFLDGRVKNTGPDTLTGVTVQVLFRNDVNLPPQVETLPLSLIRTHEPYVDTEPVSASPLKPGDDVEFRLIFETVSTNWNQQMPELQVVHVAKR